VDPGHTARHRRRSLAEPGKGGSPTTVPGLRRLGRERPGRSGPERA
jgi:hypothetical protein